MGFNRNFPFGKLLLPDKLYKDLYEWIKNNEDFPKKDNYSLQPEKEKLKPITLKQCILNVLNKWEMLAIYEMIDYIDAPEEKIRQAVANLKNTGILDSSTTRPKKYFIRAHGNPELRAMLSNSKFSKLY